MKPTILMYENKPSLEGLPPLFCEENFSRVRAFHEGLPQYEKTPLVSLDALAKKMGVKGIYIKDESKRFGLNAFKGLGASYAVSEVLRTHQGDEKPVFSTTTDGNHGKAVAWSALQAGCKAFVFMPQGSEPCRAKAIEDLGNATVTITDMNYDDAVRYTDQFAKEYGYYLVQDTAFEGYEKVPRDIVLGYSTMANEAVEELEEKGVLPTHVFLQAGVGSMAGGVLGFLAHHYKEKCPKTSIVEAAEANCIFQSVKEDRYIAVGGHPKTIMAGLNCGEANIFTLPVLKNYGKAFFSCSDEVTETGMQQLAHPVGTDGVVVSGESGAVGMGLLTMLCQEKEYEAQRQFLGLDENAVILLFSTEGDTDKENYEKIIGKKK